MAKRFVSAVLLTLIVVGYGVSWVSGAEDAPMMTTAQLSSLLAKPDLVILDVRTPYDWKKSDAKIKGAVREDPMKLGTWMSKYLKDKTLVLYCA